MKEKELERRRNMTYEQKPNLKYPFLTFQNDLYSEFMTLIMQNLEVRQFQIGEMITRELEECQEVLFVF